MVLWKANAYRSDGVGAARVRALREALKLLVDAAHGAGLIALRGGD